MQKITDALQSFDGTGDIPTWIRKLELAAKIKEIADGAGHVLTVVPGKGSFYCA